MAEFSVAVEELSDSPTEERDRNGFRATRKFKVAWADRGQLRDELLTFPGHRYPHTNIVARCTGAATRPFVDSRASQTVTVDGIVRVITSPEFAEVTAAYETDRTTLAIQNPNPTTGEVEMISESVEPMLEAIDLRSETFYYDAGATQVVGNTGKPSYMQYREMYTFVRHHLSEPPERLLEDYSDLTCNNAPLVTRLLGLTFPAETLSLVPPVIEIVADSVGSRKLTVTYKMTYQPQGWNKFPRFMEDVTGTRSFRGFSPMYWKNPVSGVVTPFKPYTPRDYSRL